MPHNKEAPGDAPFALATASPGCRLRGWANADCAALVQLANDRAVWRNLTDAFPYPYLEAHATTWITYARRPDRSLHLAIEVDGALAGGIGISAGHGLAIKTAQFGYWLGRGYWGRGVATAAARALVEHLRAAGGFARLEAPVLAWNPASMRVLEKAGFVREGVLRHAAYKDGELTDLVVYGLAFEESPPRL